MSIELQIALMAEHLEKNEEATKRGMKLVDASMSPITALLASLLRNGEKVAAEGLINRSLNSNFNKGMVTRLLSLESQYTTIAFGNIVHGIVDFLLLGQDRSEQQTFIARLQLAHSWPKSDVCAYSSPRQLIKTTLKPSKIYQQLMSMALSQPAMITLSILLSITESFLKQPQYYTRPLKQILWMAIYISFLVIAIVEMTITKRVEMPIIKLFKTDTKQAPSIEI